jgi:hypothetical protein
VTPGEQDADCGTRGGDEQPDYVVKEVVTEDRLRIERWLWYILMLIWQPESL